MGMKNGNGCYAVPELREAERSREDEKWSAEAEGQVGTMYHPTRWRPEEPQGPCARHGHLCQAQALGSFTGRPSPLYLPLL